MGLVGSRNAGIGGLSHVVAMRKGNRLWPPKIEWALFPVAVCISETGVRQHPQVIDEGGWLVLFRWLVVEHDRYALELLILTQGACQDLRLATNALLRR